MTDSFDSSEPQYGEQTKETSNIFLDPGKKLQRFHLKLR